MWYDTIYDLVNIDELNEYPGKIIDYISQLDYIIVDRDESEIVLSDKSCTLSFNEGHDFIEIYDLFSAGVESDLTALIISREGKFIVHDNPYTPEILVNIGDIIFIGRIGRSSGELRGIKIRYISQWPQAFSDNFQEDDKLCEQYDIITAPVFTRNGHILVITSKATMVASDTTLTTIYHDQVRTFTDGDYSLE